MSLILNIDTALGRASLCLAKNGESLQLELKDDQKNQAAWLHPCISLMLRNNGLKMSDLDAIAVSIGPGSYTGLRVGLAAAKGLCYGLKLPLIAVGSLSVIAYSVSKEARELICPMIDARRMEVFTALYDSSLRELISPQAMILDEESFTSILSKSHVLFCGTGASKIKSLITGSNTGISETLSDARHLANLSASSFNNQQFADLTYTEPLYLKEFYSPPRQ